MFRMSVFHSEICRPSGSRFDVRALISKDLGLSDREVEIFLDAVVAMAEPVKTYFLWRPEQHVDCVMSNLGVQVIWCDDYDDMRSCIHKLQKAGHSSQFGRGLAEFPD